jgi:hypothetical protein
MSDLAAVGSCKIIHPMNALHALWYKRLEQLDPDLLQTIKVGQTLQEVQFEAVQSAINEQFSIVKSNLIALDDRLSAQEGVSALVTELQASLGILDQQVGFGFQSANSRIDQLNTEMAEIRAELKKVAPKPADDQLALELRALQQEIAGLCANLKESQAPKKPQKASGKSKSSPRRPTVAPRDRSPQRPTRNARKIDKLNL